MLGVKTITVYPTVELLNGLDGVHFDAEKEILWITTNAGFGTVVAIRSRPTAAAPWDEAEVVAVYSAGCTYGDATSSTIDANGDILTLCAENFAMGPYALKRIPRMGMAYQAQDATSFALDFPGLIPEGIAYQPSTDRLLISPYGIDGPNYFSSAIPGAESIIDPSLRVRPSENELKLMLSLIIAGRTLIRTSFAVFTCLPKNYPRFAAAYGPSLPVKTDGS